jgi:hypothetical protein
MVSVFLLTVRDMAAEKRLGQLLTGRCAVYSRLEACTIGFRHPHLQRYTRNLILVFTLLGTFNDRQQFVRPRQTGLPKPHILQKRGFRCVFAFVHADFQLPRP